MVEGMVLLFIGYPLRIHIFYGCPYVVRHRTSTGSNDSYLQVIMESIYGQLIWANADYHNHNP